MEEKKFTFISERLARVGYSFIYEGTAAACSKCKYLMVCQGKLERNMTYKVVEVKDN
jgi:radical SAM protein with 4Fe4S-binding SPASM domain